MKKVPLISVEPVVFLYNIIVAFEGVVDQDFISTKVCFRLLNTTDVDLCRNATDNERELIKTETSVYLMYYNLLRTTLPLVFSFWIGSWNEFLGWKYPMMLPSSLSLLASVNMLIGAYFRDIPVEYTLITPLFLGLSTDLLGIFCSTFGFISDTTSIDSRSKRMTILQSMMFTGTAVGSFLSGFMLSSNDFPVMYWIIITIHITILVYILLVIPNVRSEGARDPSKISDFFDLRNVKETVKVVVRKRSGNHRLYVILLYVNAFVQYLGMQCFFNVSYVFVSDEPLAWNADEYGFLVGLKGVIQGVMLLLVLPTFYHFFTIHDSLIGSLSGLSRMAGLMFLGFSTTRPMVYAAAVLFLFSDADIAIVRSFLTKIVSKSETGRVMAAVGTFQNSARLSASFFNGLYALTVNWFKGFPLELAGVLQIIPITVYIFLQYSIEKSRRDGYEEIKEPVKSEDTEDK